MLTDCAESACCSGVVVNVTLCDADIPGGNCGTCGTSIVVIGVVSGVNVDCAGGTVVVVNGIVSRVNAD